MKLLERVKDLCSEKGISQRKLEIDLGLSNGASSKWNRSSPSGDVLDKVADYFNVSVDYLLGRTETREKYDFCDIGLNLSDDTISFIKELDEILQKDKPTREEAAVALNHVLENTNVNFHEIPLEHHDNIKLMMKLFRKVKTLDREEIKKVNQYIEKIEEEKTTEYLLPDAAHEIEGASDEDKAHDDALMDDDNF